MASIQPPDLAAFLARLTRALNTRQLPFMLIGGQAVLLHGRPRLTEDIDVTLGVPPTELPAVRDACGELGLEPLPPDVDRFVRETFVLPVRNQTEGLRVDFVFSTTTAALWTGRTRSAWCTARVPPSTGRTSSTGRRNSG